MARLARVIAPGVPHHLTQRGNRRQQTFFSDDDYRAYLDLMAEGCAKQSVEVWAYCLMPNHVHLIVVPPDAEALRRAVGEAHRRYTRRINFREGWKGYLWQGRFASFPMDEPHVLAATRYAELNPVRARLCTSPFDWPWSSAQAHRNGKDDGLATVAPLLGLVADWPAFLMDGLANDDAETMRKHERTGRPLGTEAFVERLEGLLGRPLKKARRGPKRKARQRG